jgi:16S rRNA (uracil1498-N3)-methyltransferase
MRRRFFVEGFEGSSAVLAGDAANHLGRVLRAEPGQLYELSDGESVWLARTGKVDRDTIHFTLVERLPVHPAPLRLMLLLAIVKFDRFEWAIEKATELGADEIVPLEAERTEHGLIAAAAKRAARWQRILTESAQQARRVRVPSLGEAAKPKDAFRAVSTDVRLLLSERAGARPMRTLLEPAALQANVNGGSEVPTNVAVAIGPEGGWTDAEFSAGAAAGFSEVALGANILRTETAVCAALAALQYAFGAFRPSGVADNSQLDVKSEPS